MLLKDQIKNKCLIAVLIDPEKCQSKQEIKHLAEKIEFAHVDFIFVGGSTVDEKTFKETVDLLKQNTKIPLIIFPGSSHQVSNVADGILLLNLISGRNPDFLIGHHVVAAQTLEESTIEIISTSYLLIDGGTQSSVAYVSQTTPIPQSQTAIAYKTALAGKQIGHKALFLDAGSGAKSPIPTEMIHAMLKLGQPIIVGGGIRSVEKIKEFHNAGANVVVIGNKIEDDIDFLLDIKNYIKENKETSMI